MRTVSVEIENPPRELQAFVPESARFVMKLFSFAIYTLRFRDTNTAAAFHVRRSTTGAFMHSPLAMKLKASGTPA
jgi:hypothetical protein